MGLVKQLGMKHLAQGGNTLALGQHSNPLPSNLRVVCPKLCIFALLAFIECLITINYFCLFSFS